MAKFVNLFLFVAATLHAYAQHLPNKQTASIWAPANVKIDGKPIEWAGKFQAYNHATDIFYTMANDDRNLYLVIQATQKDVINNIIGGGITFSINKKGKRNDKNSVSISYPAITKSEDEMFVNFAPKKNQPEFSETEITSLITKANAKIAQTDKYVQVLGIPGLDEILSVYNEEGIKATGLFDNAKHYTWELAVPLKYLGIKELKNDKFIYHILLNGIKPMDVFSVDGGPLPPMLAKIRERNATKNAPTDFWAVYALAKKN